MFHQFFILLLAISHITSLPNGAPKSVCQSMLPFHAGGLARQNSPPPFAVFPAAGQLAENSRLRVAVGSRQGLQFQGFMLQARTARERELIGTFVQLPAETRAMECLGENDSVTHSNTNKKGLIEFEWLPPQDFRGDVVFNATVAQDYSTFWVGLESQLVRVKRRSEITEEQPPAGAWPPQATTPPHFIPTTEGQAAKIEDPFYKGCYVEKGCFGAPDGCVKTQDCKVAVAITVKGDRYEFELKSPRDAAYVAVGLSDDDKMGDDSVIECIKENDKVKAFMSKTFVPKNGLNVERLPNPREGIELLSSNMNDGSLYCKVLRDTRTTVNGRVYDLVNDQYILLVAAGRGILPNKVDFHDIAYLAAGEKRFLSDVSEVAGASKILLRLHGAFMLVAWVGTASVGILLARYYRQTWVGKQMCGKDQWFAWHRFFMVCTWSLTVAAFVIIFVEIRGWTSERNPHAILGVVTTIICFLQPIGAFFRPHPGTPRRPLFNWLHWLGGNVAHILGIVTIFFAVKLNKAELPEWMDWILVAFVAFHVLVHLVLSLMSWLQILGCISDRTAESRVTSFPMKDLGANGRSSHSFDKKADAPKSGMRKCILGLYLFIMILFVVAMVVVIVMAPIEESWAKLRKSMTENPA